jgi:LysR family glycine cleavage system transcriptional activator
MDKLPSLVAIKAFDAVARHLSFSRAADELCVSQSAVSHQIKSLESFLGKVLIYRDKHQVSLTSAGAIYFSVVRECFQNLQTVTNHLLSHNTIKLKVLAQSSIAVDWLAPRLSLFTQAHPDIEVVFTMAARADEFKPDDFDILIGTWPAPARFISQPLRQERWFPVCTPELFAQLDTTKPDSLLKHQLYSSENGQDWQLWMQQLKLTAPAPLHMQQLSHTLLAAKAAMSGLGIALSCHYIVETALERKELIAIESLSYELPWGHYAIHYRATSHAIDKINTFVDWVVSMSREEK